MKKLLLIAIILFTCIKLQAQGWGQTQKIVPDDRFTGQQFGSDVDIDGNFAVIGMLPSGNQGRVYVFENDGTGNWIQIQKLESPAPHQFDHFGSAVAISGDYIFVGAWGQHYDSNNSNYLQSGGAVYIFKKQISGSFDFEQKIVASDREALNAFGYGIALSGDYAVVSPVRHDFDVQPGTNFLDDAGAAYIFEKDGSGTWNEVQKIVASDRAAFDYFGQIALAVNGDYIAVGSYGEDEDENGVNTILSAGSAYIFQRDGNGTWNEIQKIVASDRAQGDFFGWSIALGGNSLVVGSNQDNNFRGAVYVFEKDGSGIWNEDQKLIASNSTDGDQFGNDLDINDDRIVIGARYRDIGSPGDDGAAYIFENQASVWTETAFVYDIFNKTSEYFGFSVAISGDNALVGSYRDSEDENEENNLGSAGAAFIFDANEPNTLSVVENNFETNINAYPNPVISNLNIDFDQFYNTVDVIITNLLGQQVFFQSYQNVKSIELPFNLSKGMYVVKVSINNQSTSILKVVKQ